MNEEAESLRGNWDRLNGQLRIAERKLTDYVNSCNHRYSGAVFDPIRTEAYTEPGDPPGTMGVDWRGPFHVPAKTTKRWRRECTNCGDVQYTKRVFKTTQESPDFGSGRGGAR